MTGDRKDSTEAIEFRRLFARLKDWSDDDPSGLDNLARSDRGFEELSIALLRVAGAIQKRERLRRELFIGPVDPKFISEWRDFEERFASALLVVCTNAIASNGHKLEHSLEYSFDVYEEPNQWKMADYNALMTVQWLETTLRYARAQAELVIDAADQKYTWHKFNPKYLSPEMDQLYDQVVESTLNLQNALDDKRIAIRNALTDSIDEAQRSELREQLFALESLADEEGPALHASAKDGWMLWEDLKREAGLDLRGILRRRTLVPFVLFPRHVSARLGHTDLPSIYQTLRQAHEAFVFGLHFAALALMRSVLEATLQDHYGATGDGLHELINSVSARLPKKANAAALHRLRKLANEALHSKSDQTADVARMENTWFEREIVSLFFVLRALVEGAPMFRGA